MESIINVIVIFIAGLALLISILSLRTSTRTMKHNAFVNVQKEYRTPEMGNAVHSLWNFFRYKCNEDENILKTKFGKLIENDLKNMSKIDDESKKLEYYKSTFDNQRRLVSQFYHH